MAWSSRHKAGIGRLSSVWGEFVMILGGQWDGHPALVAHADGHLEVFAVGQDGLLYGKPQAGPGGPFDEVWLPVGTGGPADSDRPSFDPSTTRVGYTVEPSGVMTIFARSTAGRVVYTYLTPREGWSRWRTIPTGDAVLGNPVAPGRLCSAPPFLLLRRTTGDLVYGARADLDDPEGWDAVRWTNLSGAHTRHTSVGVSETRPHGGLEIVLFAIGPGRDVWTHCPQLDTLRPTSTAASSYDGRLPGIATQRSGAHVAGRLVPVSASSAVWRGENGSIWHAVMRAPGILGDVRDLGFAVVGDPATASSSGSAWIAGRTEAGHISVWRRRSGREWEPVTCTEADSAEPAASDPALAVGADGLADVVFVGRDRRIHHLRQACGFAPARRAHRPTVPPTRTRRVRLPVALRTCSHRRLRSRSASATRR